MQFREKHTYIALSVLLLIVGLLGSAEGAWEEKAPMPTARYELSTSVVDGMIYAIGGFGGTDELRVLSTVEVYDPATDTWTMKADMPAGRYAHSASVVNGKIYVIGGFGGDGGDELRVLSTVEVYDPATDIWTIKADMPTGRTALSTSVVDGKIYAIGGTLPEGWAVPIVEEYDPATDTWTEKIPMSAGRTALSTSVVDGKIYAIGGEIDGYALAEVEAYDPITHEWTLMAAMLTGRFAHSAGVVKGRIYVIGGLSHGTVSPLETMEMYDPKTNMWVTRPPLPIGVFGSSSSVVDDAIYVFGGANSPSATNKVYRYSDKPPYGGFSTGEGSTDDPLDVKLIVAASDDEQGAPECMCFCNAPEDDDECLSCGDHKALSCGDPGSSSWVCMPYDTSADWKLSPGDGKKKRICAVFIDDTGHVSHPVVSVIHVPVEEMEAAGLPSSFALFQNYPNPFNPFAFIAYDLPEACNVSLCIYTPMGQEVEVLVDRHQEAGYHTAMLNGSGLANGVYLYRLEAGDFVETKRMVLLK